MGMSSTTRTGILAAAAAGTLAVAALAGTAVANAAGSTNPSPSATAPQGQSPSNDSGSTAGRQQRPVEEALTGDTAAKVKAAVEAKYPGATIDRMEKDADGQSVYEAHITKADGTRVTVLLDASFTMTGEWAGGPGGRGAGQQRPAEEALTGDTAAKVKAAVEAAYPSATIDRMEKDADGQSVYEAHITKADGTRVTVLLDASFAVTGESASGPGRHGVRHGHRQGSDQQGGATPSSGGTSSSSSSKA